MLRHERFPSSETRDRHRRGWGQTADKLAGFFARARRREGATVRAARRARAAETPTLRVHAPQVRRERKRSMAARRLACIRESDSARTPISSLRPISILASNSPRLIRSATRAR